MNEPLRRGVRTLAQVLLAAAGGLGTLVAVGVLTAHQAEAAGAVCTFVATLLAVIQNGLEEKGAIPVVPKPAVRSRMVVTAKKPRV